MAGLAGRAAIAAAGGEQCSQGIAGVDCAPAAHGPAGRAGVLGCFVFLDTKVFKLGAVHGTPGQQLLPNLGLNSNDLLCDPL